MRRNKIFFVKLLVFVILALVLNACFSVVYTRWMYYYRLARNQDRQFAAYTGRLKYLMLGNSHNRVNPAIVGPGFCYITPKEVYKQTYYKLKYILEKTDKHPENILLSIDPVNFSPRAENDLTFDGYWRKYLDYRELAREYHDPGYLMNWVNGTFFSYVGNYKYAYMSLLFIRTDLKKVRNGYIPARNYKNFAKEPNREVLGFGIAKAYLSSYSGKSELGDMRHYFMILDLCRKYRIHLILLRMPMTDEYLSYAGKMVNYDTLDHAILKATKEHCNDFELLDYRNEFHGKPQYFFNADHVNPVGAMIISWKIKDRLDHPERYRTDLIQKK
jgi:hypothetical protein